MAASKVFNMPELSSAYCITENEIICKQLNTFIEASELGEGHLLRAYYHHAYSRIINPTVQYFEDRLRYITGAVSVTALNSGMVAISNTLMTVAYAGSNIVTSSHLFGNTYFL